MSYQIRNPLEGRMDEIINRPAIRVCYTRVINHIFFDIALLFNFLFFLSIYTFFLSFCLYTKFSFICCPPLLCLLLLFSHPPLVLIHLSSLKSYLFRLFTFYSNFIYFTSLIRARRFVTWKKHILFWLWSNSIASSYRF